MIKLDEKNRKLIASLIKNCRNSDLKIAKEIGLSREVVAYRIKSLEEQKLIKKYTTEINFNRLGFLSYSLGIKLNNISKEGEKRIVAYLIDNKKVVYLQKTLSRFDFVGTILVKSLQELEEEINKIRKVIGRNLKNIEVGALIGDYDFLASFFARQSNIGELVFLDNEIVRIEGVDKRILEELVKDSRITAVELSKKLRLSVFTIADRIKKLVKEKIILAFRPVIDISLLGYNRYTILLNVFDDSVEDKLVNFCRNHKLIWDIGKFVENYNYAIEVYAENNQQFLKVVEEITSEFSDSIIDYETLIILEEIKHSYFFT